MSKKYFSSTPSQILLYKMKDELDNQKTGKSTADKGYRESLANNLSRLYNKRRGKK